MYYVTYFSQWNMDGNKNEVTLNLHYDPTCPLEFVEKIFP